MSNKQMNLENGLNDIDDIEEIDWLTDEYGNYILDENSYLIENGSNECDFLVDKQGNDLVEDENHHRYAIDMDGNYFLIDDDGNYIAIEDSDSYFEEKPCRCLIDKQGNYKEDWYKYFVFNEDGSIKSSCLNNILIILNNDVTFDGLFQYNKSTNSIEKIETRICDLKSYANLEFLWYEYGDDEFWINKGMLEENDVYSFKWYCELVYQGVSFKINDIYKAFEYCAKLDLND